MKKTYSLEHPKIKAPRIVDSIKHDIKKMLKNERKKPLPAQATYWGFDCRFGQSEEAAVGVHLSGLTKGIDSLVENDVKTIYIEVSPKPMTTNKSTAANIGSSAREI